MKTLSHFSIFILLYFLTFILLIGCVDTPSKPTANNPLDADNPLTGGDPYHLQAEIADGGVRLTWQAVAWKPLTGYTIFRKDNTGSFNQLQQVNTTTLSYTDMSIQNGHSYEYYVVTRSASAQGEASNVATVTINADPVIFIEGESITHTPTRNVNLTMIAYGAQKMLLSNNANFLEAQWEPFSTTKSWQLSTGVGTKSVYAKVVFADEDTSGVVTDQIEPQALVPSISINTDSTYINHRGITLSLETTGALHVKLSNVPDSVGVNWQDCINEINWNLSAGDGWKHIYAWLKNDFFVSNMVSDSIGLDTRVSISSFVWSSTGGDTLVPDDQITFRVIAANDNFGAESGGIAEVSIEGWDGINLIGQGNGSYTGNYTLTNETPKVSNSRVSVSFTDRAGNEVSDAANETLTAYWSSAGDERIFPLGNSGESIVMCWIPAGSFDMGSPNGEQDRDGDEGPVHRVTFAAGFWLGKYEVTQGQWEAVMGNNPSSFSGADHPVERVSWTDIQGFESALGNAFRLPSEAEWEYACRAGTTTRFYWGDDGNYSQIGSYAWYTSNSSSATHPVGQKTVNAWGLYDMSGNVWEWCEDWYHSDYTDAPSDGSAWVSPSGSYRVLRGGSWSSNARSCRSANRGSLDPSSRYIGLGFRLLRSL